jgi:uncharacterized protein YceH (UPF0502 family)
VLGCLVEKQLTTPQQYPLTLNAVVVAANQTTNRDPVVTLEDDVVLAALDELRGRQLIRVVLPSHGRSVKRYRHVLDEVFGLDAARYALLAVLLLRGPQTVGELRARSERMVEFSSVDDVQHELTVLAGHAEELVRLQPRRPGQKEDRWQQIVAAPWGGDPPSGEGDGTEPGGRTDAGPSVIPPSAVEPDPAHGLDDLRSEVDALRAEVAVLRDELAALRQGLGG